MNLNAKQDDEGFMITFDNEQEAKLFLEKATQTTHCHWIPPTDANIR